ncbi:MAG: carboxylating nicotinate-nucleotide diphosphorylase [Abditibacteriaceae bacterium]
MNLPIPNFQLIQFIEAALAEDIRSGDITTNTLIPADAQAVALMRFRESGIVCGIEAAKSTFQLLDSNITLKVLLDDGSVVNGGEVALEIRGNARAILTAERVALNIVQHLSGIATATAQYVKETEGTKARIVDTRKTTPGLRLLEKYAVRCGGGHNHRYALDDMILIKDNHVALCGGVQNAVSKARENVGQSVKIEVECDTIDQVREALQAGAELILLDNMPPGTLREAVAIVNGKALCEASGGINLLTVRGVAQSGVDVISVGALTHSVRALDVGLDIELKIN